MSMLLCIVTSAALYLAADSRQYPSGADTVQKVFLVGRDAILAHGGIGVIPYDGPSTGSWDAAEEIGRISAQTPIGTFEEQLHFIQQQVLSTFGEALERHSSEIASERPHLTIMLSKRDSKGRAYFARQELKVVSTIRAAGRWVHRAEANPAQLLVNGEEGKSGVWWEVPPECQVRPEYIDFSPRKALASISAIIARVAGQSAFCGQRIGGPIRVAISDSTGARWLSE